MPGEAGNEHGSVQLPSTVLSLALRLIRLPMPPIWIGPARSPSLHYVPNKLWRNHVIKTIEFMRPSE
jgi:hypothetical protein